MTTKNILITGGSRGIGRSAALLAGARGWSVAVNFQKDERAANEVVAKLKAMGVKAIALQGDVSVEGEAVGVFDRATAANGPLDGVVVNAGVVAPSSKLVDMSVERMRRILEVNTLGALICAREAARRMARSRGGKGGSIVLISSAAARLGAPDLYVDYAASKGAIDTLTTGLSRELGPEGVRVNGIRPGLIETDLHASGGEPGRAQRLGVGTPFGRPGTADEIGEAIVWLLSDASSYAGGAIIDVTGGR